MNQANISVEQLLAALQRRGIPLPFEIGTFVVLQAAEQALVLEATEKGLAAPPVVAMSGVWLGEEGEVSVEPSRSAESEQEACRALVVLLGDLLVRSAPGVPPMLLELVEQGPSDGQWSLMRLRDDLEAALVPLNRGAMRRVLARLLREVRRDVERSPATPAPDARRLDRELDSLFGVQTPDPPPSSVPPPAAPAVGQADEELPDPSEQPTTLWSGRSDPKVARLRSSVARAARPRAPEELPEGPDSSLDAFERTGSASGGAGARVGLGLAVLAAVLVGAFLLFGPERSREALGLETEQDAARAAAASAAAASHPRPTRRYGELRVTSTPAQAQVLMLVGQGPALATDLPVGVAHEFVALADGRSPSRVVVPADAAFAPEGARMRYELALQLEEAGGRRPSDELGDTRLPQNVGAPKGTLGDVRVVTSPPGAKVYQLIGFTPDVSVQNLRIEQPLQLLVYASGYELSRIDVNEGSWKPRPDGTFVAEIDVQLVRKRR